MSKEIYVSTDVETDGPIPGPNSMLSFGSAAFDEDGKLLSTFAANLETLPFAEADPSTAAWWKTQPKAWEECRRDPRDPSVVMPEYVAWIKGLGGRPVFVGYPAGFDFTWIYWYIRFFKLESPFSFSALDIKTYASAVLKVPFREATKRNFPKRWFGQTKHNHQALTDAIEQGELFMAMRRDHLGR